MAKESKSTTTEADIKVDKKDTKQAAAEVKETKAAETVKADSKQEEPKKEEPKKTQAKPKKAVKEKTNNVKKEPVVAELFVQYDDDSAGAQEAKVADIVAKVKAEYIAQGHRESSIKSLQIYMKTQMWKAYYVINNKIEGNIDLF